MKKWVMLTAIILLTALLLLTTFKYVVVADFMFGDAVSVDKTESDRIKSVVLQAIKNEWSVLYGNENSDERSLFVNVDTDFMDTLRKTADNGYSLEVKLNWPQDWVYYIDITQNGGEYKIVSKLIDP